ncbi:MULTISPECIES: DegQ family serine endoprotease [Acetobacter]|uniref:Probable periplasmic serine endoprotease DegP-like n=1 Tax=Acetobacter pomorum DM001 TaxID=945681 RepID=F1YQ53_9PROT|nr:MULTISPECIES: DegQ family serine endoprotease [Acetobacter]ATI12456.1 serine protease [Acetobacter pomorum]AXC27406.1 DegQ family serine endoprotease [Acetobacter sp. JWB]EGE49050.1 Putative serine protease do-like protein [Acetobacter pomorum DM001]KAA8426712.1 DegQ family serine endoprotease [Acetobacter pomorum]KAA8436544.1 DegQ family serine endoprotease [Acetobacter pomorum]
MRISARFARVFSLSGLLLAGASFAYPAQADQASTTAPPVMVAQRVPESFADLAAKLLPAVVNVSTTQTVRADSDDDDEDDQLPQMPNFPQGSPFEKFFHDFMNRQTEPDAPPRRMQALGSGFIIDPTGYIVTNNHVIRKADRITVTLQDNTVLTAKAVGHDDRTDLALLKVESKKPLPFVQFGNSDSHRVGDWVLAIGNPFGLSGTVTAGIISSRGRNIDQGPYDDFIQTDAPINKGNSGGPLFDMNGQVIGVNTAIYSPSGGSVGIGFAIPSNEARNVVEQLRKTGKVSRGWLGVRIQNVTQDIADGLGLTPARGALVAGVEKNGPAAKAGLQTGDVIQALNAQPIEGKALPRLSAQLPVGSVAHLGVWRHGKILDLPVTIAALPEPAADTPQKPAAPSKTKETVSFADFGFSVGVIDTAARQKYGLSANQKGVLVTSVQDDGLAADRGLKPGDVITEVQQAEVNTPADLKKRIEAAKKDKKRSVLLLVHDSDGLRWIPFSLTGEDTSQ